MICRSSARILGFIPMLFICISHGRRSTRKAPICPTSPPSFFARRPGPVSSDMPALVRSCWDFSAAGRHSSTPSIHPSPPPPTAPTGRRGDDRRNLGLPRPVCTCRQRRARRRCGGVDVRSLRRWRPLPPPTPHVFVRGRLLFVRGRLLCTAVVQGVRVTTAEASTYLATWVWCRTQRETLRGQPHRGDPAARGILSQN